jgi:hypothetical protein
MKTEKVREMVVLMVNIKSNNVGLGVMTKWIWRLVFCDVMQYGLVKSYLNIGTYQPNHHTVTLI